PKSTFPTQVEELEKMLGSMAMAGVQVAGFDNLSTSTPLQGAPLDKYLSARDVKARILGKSETPTLTWNAVVIVTGNNVSVLGDTVRRAIKCRLEPDVERPEERTGFANPDPKAYARKHRPALVVAGLTILRAYFVAGCPVTRPRN